VGYNKSHNLNLGRLSLNAFRWMDAGFTSLMSQRGWKNLPKASSLVFPHLREDGIRPAQIARLAGVSRQAVNQVLKDLRERGLVKVTSDPKDQRSLLVMYTRRGRRFGDDAASVAVELEKELYVRLGPRKVQQMRACLEDDWGPPLDTISQSG